MKAIDKETLQAQTGLTIAERVNDLKKDDKYRITRH